MVSKTTDLVEEVAKVVIDYLEGVKMLPEVNYHVTSCGTLSDVVVFTNTELMKDKGYSTVKVNYSDEEGYTFYMVGEHGSHVIKLEDKPCLLGLIHVSNLKKLNNFFKKEGVSRRSIFDADCYDLFMDYCSDMLLEFEKPLATLIEYVKLEKSLDVVALEVFSNKFNNGAEAIVLIEKSSVPEDLEYLKVDFFNPYGGDVVDVEQERGAYFISAFTPRGVKDMGDCTKVVLFLDDLLAVRDALKNSSSAEGLKELESNGILVIY